jgi:hypothetical protein
VSHAKRLEDVFAGEVLEGFATDAFDEDCRDVEAGVGVTVRRAGIEIEGSLFRREAQEILIVEDVGALRLSAELSD